MLQSLALCALLACPALARSDFDEARAELEAVLLPRLEELAGRANDMKFFATRNRCYRAMLVLDPEDGTARRGLKYKRVNGEWVPSGSARKPKDAKARKVPRFVTELDEALDDHRRAVLALIETHAESLGAADVRGAYERLVRMQPENDELHELVGEARLEGRWVLAETARTVERRRELQEVARTSFEDAPLGFPTSPNDFETELGLDWSTGYQTDRVRVFGTGDPAEVEEAARAAHAMGDLFAAAFGQPGTTAADFTLYLLANPGEKDRLLRRLPGVRKDRGANLSQASGGWLGRASSFGNWSDDRPRRVDGAARTTASQYLQRAFRVDLKHGWAAEGIGLYLVETMLGTHLTWFTRKDHYVATRDGDDVEEFNLQNTGLDWRAAGTDMLLGESAPRLGPLIGRPLSAMTPRDLLHAYMLAAYLIEGRPEVLPELLTTIGRGENPTKAFERALGETLPQIEEHMQRWVEEMQALRDSGAR